MKKITSKKLLKYGTLSAAALGCSISNAQIIYTDIDDIDVFLDGPLVGLDIDGDSVQDLTAYGATSITAVFAASSSGDEVIPNMNTIAGLYFDGYNYASNFEEGETIDADTNFIEPGQRAELNSNGCAYYNSQFCDGVIDGYIGFALQINNATHYGWMRVDVTELGDGFIIKDFAYEATPDTAITVGEVLSLEDNTIEGLTSLVANNALTINGRNSLENVTIHNLNGQVVVSQKLTNTTETIDLSALSTGMYIATVQTEGKVKSIKFVK